MKLTIVHFSLLPQLSCMRFSNNILEVKPYHSSAISTTLVRVPIQIQLANRLTAKPYPPEIIAFSISNNNPFICLSLSKSTSPCYITQT